MTIKEWIKSSWMPVLIIILVLGGLALFLPEVTADPISLQDTTIEDWFELEKTPIAFECLAWDGIPGESKCTNQIATEYTLDKLCLGVEWDWTDPMPFETAFNKVGGFNHYKYCINEITLKNPTTDFVSTTDFIYRLTDMGTGGKEVQFLIEDPVTPGQLILWEAKDTKMWDVGLATRIYAYGEKHDIGDTIEWDFELTYKPENLTYYKDPFWDGSGGENASAVLVVDGKFIFDRFESYALDTKLNPSNSPYNNYSNTAEGSIFNVSTFDGNQFVDHNRTGRDLTYSGLVVNNTDFGSNYSVRVKTYGSDSQFTVSWRMAQTEGASNFNGYVYQYVWQQVRFILRDQTNSTSTKVIDETYGGTQPADKWRMHKIEVRGNETKGFVGRNLDKFNETVQTITNATLYSDQGGLGLIPFQSTNGTASQHDNFIAYNIADQDYVDTSIQNISAVALYSDAEGDPWDSRTCFWDFDSDTTIDLTQVISSPSDTNYNCTVNADSWSAGEIVVYIQDCDDGGQCNNVTTLNTLTLSISNQPPVMDNVNISSTRGWNTSGENLFGGFNWSDPDADSFTNETLWWKEGSIVAALNDLQEISSSNTSAGETWAFSARVNDGTVWSGWKNSSNLTINTVPTQDAPILNSTDNSNQSSQNLTVYNQTTADVDDHPIKNIVLWLKENNHYAHLYLPFEGGSLNGNSTGVPNGTRDYSEHGNNATVYNATWLPTGGYDGFGAYSFDGIDDFIDLNASTLNFNQTSGTMMLWFKLGDAASWSDGLTRNLFQFRGGSGNAATLYKSDSNEMRWRYVANSIADEVALNVGSRTDTDWHHMAMTWSVADQEMIAYWDGVQTGATQVIANNWTQDAETGKIGVRFSNDLNFNGTIDEVQSYHHALSAEQILAFATNITDMVVSQETAQGQVWKAEMTPNDGREDGLTTASNTLTILNAIPTIPNLNITSSDPLNYTNGTLTAYHNYADVDSDAWIANSTKWYRNTTEQTNLYNLTSLASENLTAEDTWVYSAAVQDAIGDWSIWYNASIYIPNAPPYEISIPQNIAFDEDSYNDTFTNASIFFFDLEQTKLGFEFYWNDTNLNTTITNATGAILFTAKNDWFGSVTGYFVAVDNSVAKGNGTNFTITVNNVNDKPTIPYINITSTDMLNRTNGTLIGDHGYADLENNTWIGNWTRWFKDGVAQISFENTSTVANSSVASGESWIYAASVYDGFNWSDWLNSTSLTITDSNASVSIITLNNSLGYFDFEDIGFSFKPFDPDGGSVIVSLNITNNNVNIYSQLASILSDTTYSGNLTQTNFNQTQVINITVLPNSVVTELKNSTTTIKSITVTASDSWYYGINETESGGYNITITESSAYPYDINLSAILYRDGITYTPSTLQYRTGGVTIFNVTIPMPLTPNNHTNISSRWAWNQSVYGVQSTTTETSRNQTVDHGYFLTDFFSTPTNLLEAERFLARINYSSLQLATISNATFELTGLNFSATLNGSTQFFNSKVYANLLADADNSSILTLQAKTNYTYLDQSFLRNKNTTVTINKMILGECARTWDEFNESTLYNLSTHTYRMYNESNPTVNATGTVEVTYDIFQDRNQEHRNYSFNLQNQWNHTVCIYPTWATFSTDTVIQYTGTNGFVPRTYYHYNLSLSNNTVFTDLYLIDDSIDSAINVYLLDQDDNAITKALLNVLRFYPEESVYRTVQISESDINGLALIKIQLTDVLYKLIMYKDGELIDQTDKFPFIDSDYFFRINILADFLDSWTKVGELNKFLSVNNATGLGTFYWNDGEDIVQTGCLEVFTRTGMRDNQLYYQCLNASTGTITYTINTSNEGRYFFRSTIDTNTNNTEYYMETRELFIENASAIFGIFGVFLTLLFFVGVASAGFSHNPSTPVMFGTGVFLVMAVLGFIYFPWVGIITLLITAIFIIYMIRT